MEDILLLVFHGAAERISSGVYLGPKWLSYRMYVRFQCISEKTDFFFFYDFPSWPFCGFCLFVSTVVFSSTYTMAFDRP